MTSQAEGLLRGWLTREARVERAPRDPQADLIVRDGRSTLVIEVKRLAEPGWLREGIQSARAAASRVSRNAVPVLAVPFMAEGGRKVCEEAGISWLDLSGNADIVAPGLRIYVEGRPNKFKRRGRPSSAFAPKSARIVRTFLTNPGRAFKQRELSYATGLDDGRALDEGFVSRIVRKLIADRMVEKGADGLLRLSDPSLVLDAWRDAYDFSKHRVVAGHVSARSSTELVVRVARSLREEKLAFAATGLAGAWLMTHFATFRLTTFFVADEPTDNLLRRIGFRAEERGANVWLVVPNDEGVFAGASEREGVRCVHPVQAYLDLKGHPERSAEAADEVRRQLLG
jgi:hypothetical protein